MKKQFLFVLIPALALFLILRTQASFAADEFRKTESVVRQSSEEERDGEKEKRVLEIVNSPVLSEFNVWAKNYSQEVPLNVAGENLNTGEVLAVRRKELLKELIRLSPETSLNLAVSEETYSKLPSSVARHVERPASFRGNFLISVYDGIESRDGQTRESEIKREVVVGDARYEAYVYGRKATMTSKFNVPLRGIILDEQMAVAENSVEKIEPGEFSGRNIDRAKLGGDRVAATVGGETKYFSDQTEFDDYASELSAWELKIAPSRSESSESPNQPSSSWTAGAKTVLVVRVDFPDRAGEPVDQAGAPLTEARAQSVINGAVNQFYVSNSYNKTSLAVGAVTPVLRMSHPQSYYTGANIMTALMTEARIAARAAGFEPDNYNLDIFAFSFTNNLSFSGSANIGAKGLLLNGFFDFKTVAHELGHNYGLFHANLWQTTDGSVIGQGSNLEYGDPFDVMGRGGSQATHFNAEYKRRLDWLTSANVLTITQSGTYRVYAFDSISAPTGIHALRIKRDNSKDYWIESRQLFATPPTLSDGAFVHWDYAYTTGRQTQILDMAPATPTLSDIPLQIGQTFSDDNARLKITVLGKGDTTPESLDIKVEQNIGCTFTAVMPAAQNFSAGGGEATIIVNTQAGCLPPLASGDDWIIPVASDTAADGGSATARFIVTANYGSQARAGSVTVAGQTFAVQQSGAVTVCAAPPSDLVSWWRGEGDASDRTGANNGALSGAASFAGGKIGGAFKFAGAAENKIFVPDSDSLRLTRSLSVEGWIKLPASGAGGHVISRRDDADTDGSFRIQILTARVPWFVVKSASSATAPSATANANVALPADEFVHLAATLDDATGQMKIYVNGNLLKQITTTVRPYQNLDSSRNPRIDIGGNSFNGVIDELSIYNRALSAAEIQAIYNAGTAATGAAGKCLSAQSPNATRGAFFDFDGDGKSDVAVYRRETGVWYLLNSSSGFTASQFGISTDKIVPADYDGDGRTDLAVYRPETGVWYLLRSTAGFTGIQFGAPEDKPFPADLDGDGKAELVVYRPSSGVWYSLNLTNYNFTAQPFGIPTDIPVPADYDGDGKSDVAVYRPESGVWYFLLSARGFAAFQFGVSEDRPVPADYDGDGKTDVAVYRPSNGVWYILGSTSGFYGVQFGIETDKPVAADFDGDGKTDQAVYRPESGVWYILGSTSGFYGIQFGIATDKPVPNYFVR